MDVLKTLHDLIAGKSRDDRQGAIQMRRLMKDWTREELEDVICAVAMGDFHEERAVRNDWFWQWYLERHERQRLENVLTTTYHTQKELNRAVHVADIEEKNKELKRQIRIMQVASEERNREAWATGLIVHCTGCEAGAPFNADDLTEEKVRAVEGIASRLRTWWRGHQARMERSK